MAWGPQINHPPEAESGRDSMSDFVLQGFGFKVCLGFRV